MAPFVFIHAMLYSYIQIFVVCIGRVVGVVDTSSPVVSVVTLGVMGNVSCCVVLWCVVMILDLLMH
jgi:hypothetical protein